jgi:hypothetical protein
VIDEKNISTHAVSFTQCTFVPVIARPNDLAYVPESLPQLYPPSVSLHLEFCQPRGQE